ncbi:MAG TPA: hypothetical protein VMU40_07685 [Steroidobacteraceae bacterium]|nr:hypothetical protein [Steroidobacteraceae bacterium]
MSRQSDYDAGYFAELARQVSKGLGRDNAVKERIVQRSPHVFYGMDAEAAGQASAAELAARELRELGITPRNSDPVELLDAHHAGRDYARNAGDGRRSLSGARDSAGDSFVDRYLKE